MSILYNGTLFLTKDLYVIKKLKKEMKQAAERLDFERAATIRDRIYQMKNATDSNLEP